MYWHAAVSGNLFLRKGKPKAFAEAKDNLYGYRHRPHQAFLFTVVKKHSNLTQFRQGNEPNGKGLRWTGDFNKKPVEALFMGFYGLKRWWRG